MILFKKDAADTMYNRLLQRYEGLDLVIRRKARFLLSINLFLLVLLPLAFIGTSFYTEYNLIMGGSLGGCFLVIVVTTAALILGAYNFAAHGVLLAIFVALWTLIFADVNRDPVAWLDTVALIPGGLALVPLLALRRPAVVFGYLAVNLVVLAALSQQAVNEKAIDELQRADFLSDNALAFITISVVGFLIARLNEGLLLHLRNLLDESDERAREREQVITLLRRTSEGLQSTARSLVDQVRVFSDETNSQAASVEQLTSAITELSQSNESISDLHRRQQVSLAEADERIDQLQKLISRAEEEIRSVDAARDALRKETEATHQDMSQAQKELHAVWENFGNVVDVVKIIHDISEKTNMLALNASIEAARAGEHGRGFAVVADEVSKLADMASSNARTISDLVNQNRDGLHASLERLAEFRNALESMVDGGERLDRANASVTSFLREDLQLKRELGERTAEIKNASEQLAVAMREFVPAFQEIMSTAASINDATQRIAEGANSLQNEAARVQRTGDDLNEVLGDQAAQGSLSS